MKSVLCDNQFFSRYGKDPAEIGKQFFILDAEGLITKARHNLSELEVTLINCRKLDFRNHISTTFFPGKLLRPVIIRRGRHVYGGTQSFGGKI